MLILILLIFCASTVLFGKAAGTLNPGKLNVISYVYYLFMLQSFVGISLILLGFDEHYTLDYLLNPTRSLRDTAVAVWATSLFLPLIILVCQKIFRVNAKRDFSSFLKGTTEGGNQNMFFFCLCAVTVLCGVVLAGFLIKIGYIPLFRLLHAPEGFDFSTERTRISGLYFIHPYITNILVLSVIPLLSYVGFAYMLVCKTKKWFALSAFLFAMAVVVKMYKFEKSPLVFHLLVYVLIFIYFKGGIRMVYMIVTGAILFGIIIAAYFATGFSGNLLDIYNGPLGRTFFTQVGTLAYCFDLFPNVFGFLNGRSFSPTILKILGMDPTSHLRSAKLTMAFYGSEKVYDGSAGVMNALFVGEAYSNWGYAGVAFSIIWVGLIISFIVLIILKMRKTPSSITLMAIMSVKIGSMLEGGFCDFVYSFDMIFTFVILICIYFFFEKPGKIQCIVLRLGDSLTKKIRIGLGR